MPLVQQTFRRRRWRMIIAIDGPAASGKGTLAKRIAAHFGFHHLDTGTLYRAVARDLARRGLKLDDVWAGVVAARVLNPTTLDDPALRGREAGEAASVVAAIPEVRATLLKFQQDFARKDPGTVLDGRDIGTVVCPQAEVKIYVTASPQERARRRHAELAKSGAVASYEQVLAAIRARDARDAGRETAPMKPAQDAALLDTTHLDIDAAFRAAVDLISTRTGRLGRSSL
jgi:CMP/dCMP kinase